MGPLAQPWFMHRVAFGPAAWSGQLYKNVLKNWCTERLSTPVHLGRHSTCNVHLTLVFVFMHISNALTSDGNFCGPLWHAVASMQTLGWCGTVRFLFFPSLFYVSLLSMCRVANRTRVWVTSPFVIFLLSVSMKCLLKVYNAATLSAVVRLFWVFRAQMLQLASVHSIQEFMFP